MAIILKKQPCYQEEFSLALTEMRTADPGEATLTLKNPKLDGSSLAKRRKTKAELEPVGNDESSEASNGKGALRVVSEDSGVDVKEQEAASTDRCEKDGGKEKESIWCKKEESYRQSIPYFQDQLRNLCLNSH